MNQWAVVVAQLVEQSLPIPEVRDSNPVIGKKIIMNIYYQLFWKKRSGMAHFFKKIPMNQDANLKP